MNKWIYAIDLVILVLSVFGIIFLVGYAKPLVIAPIDDYQSSNRSVLFEFDKANTILVDDNIEFSSPEKIYVEDNLVVNLKPGKYYWKVQGLFGSEIRTLTINSEIDLKLRRIGNESYEVVNAGNLPLNVEIYDNENKTGEMILDVDDSGMNEGDKFVGRQNE